MLARLATRLLIAPLGFVCGLLAGFATLALMCSNRLGGTAMFPEEVMLLGVDIAVGGWMIALVLAPLIGAPAIVGVLIGEMFAIRSWVYYASGGALTAVLPWALLPSGVDGAIFATQDILACGFVGGLTHWLVAGRQAGFRSSDLDPHSNSPLRGPPPDRTGP